MLFTGTAAQAGTQIALYRDARIEITRPFSNIIDAGQTTSAGLNWTWKDSIIFLEQWPTEEQWLLKQIYDLDAEKIKELGKPYLPHFRVISWLTDFLNLDCDRYIEEYHASLAVGLARLSVLSYDSWLWTTGENIQWNHEDGAGVETQKEVEQSVFFEPASHKHTWWYSWYILSILWQPASEAIE